MSTNVANVVAQAAYGGDDKLSKWQLMAELLLYTLRKRNV